MRKRWKNLSRGRRVGLLGLLLVVLLCAGGYGYFALRTAGAPAPASLGDAPRSGAGELNGEWILPRENIGFVGYRVREKLGVVPAPNDAVGRTTTVRATMTVSDGRIEAAQVTADLTTVRSDEPGRDPAAQTALATDQFPEGRFRLVSPVDLGSPTKGEEIRFSAHGRLTLRGISKEVDFPLEARWNGDTFQIAGQLEIRREDFDLEFPQQLGMRVSNSAKVEVQLTFIHRGSPTTPPPATTDETATEPTEPQRKERAATGPGRLLVSMVEEDGQTIAIYAVDVDGTQRERLFRPARRPGWWSADLSPTLSSDGSALLYTRGLSSQMSGEPDQIYRLPAEGSSRPKPLTDNPSMPSLEPAWSPDGRKIAFSRGTQDSALIWTMDADGSHARQISKDAATPDTSPTWSPNGDKIAYTSFVRGGNEDIFVMNADGSGVRRITEGPQYDSTPAWSPDGTKIAFNRDGDIYVMRPDGSGLRRLTRGSARDAAPAWSRDGRWLALQRADERGRTFAGPSRIIVMRADGSHVRRVRLPREASEPSWVS